MDNANIKLQTKRKLRRKKIIKRLIFDLIIFLVFIIMGTVLLNNALDFSNEKIVQFNEASNLDYKVYLLENNIYEKPYLGKDMIYVANLIDKIAIDFDYSFTSEDTENIDFDYQVIAKLAINNQLGTKSYFEKSYILLENKKVQMTNSKVQNIKERIDLDYPYYNNLANGFKNQYIADAESKLTVYMLINKKNGEKSEFNLDSSSVMSVVIPLSERSVDIKLDYKEINETSNIIKKENNNIHNYYMLAISAISIIISLIMLIKAIRNTKLLIPKKSPYDKLISKILKEYDRLIAESATLLSFQDKEMISIKKFTELLDIHDNLQLPIMFYEEIEHELCYFYICHNSTVYLLEVSSDNIDNIK